MYLQLVRWLANCVRNGKIFYWRVDSLAKYLLLVKISIASNISLTRGEGGGGTIRQNTPQDVTNIYCCNFFLLSFMPVFCYLGVAYSL